ncbi:MAG TPA: hypothetical protein VIL18_09020 [Longimicrobiales bacterium]|jgi:hypothetical protein
MRGAAIATVACALAAAVTPTEAAAQSRVPPAWPDAPRGTRGGAFDRLFDEDPRFVVWPMAAVLGDGTHEQRLNARLTWPAADTAPDFALHLFAGLAAGRDAYTRSGLRFDVSRNVGPAHVTGSAAIAGGFGEGPRQTITVTLGGGLPALRLEVRSTWFEGGRSASFRTLDPALPELPSTGRTDLSGHYTDGELNALHRLGRVALRVTAGHRFGGETGGTRQWMFGETDIPVWRRFGIVLAGGVRPERPELAQPGGRFAQVGLRVDFRSARKEPEAARPADVPPPAPAVVPIEPGVYLVRLRVPGARRVELKGDITDWEIVTLRRSTQHPDLWEETFRKPAGVYHVNIRVDGGDWAVPPGLVAVPDRFGGTVGVLDFPPTAKQEVNDAA